MERIVEAFAGVWAYLRGYGSHGADRSEGSAIGNATGLEQPLLPTKRTGSY